MNKLEQAARQALESLEVSTYIKEKQADTNTDKGKNL